MEQGGVEMGNPFAHTWKYGSDDLYNIHNGRCFPNSEEWDSIMEYVYGANRSVRLLFLAPRPALEPKPLEWKPVYMNEVGGAEIVAIDGYWSFYAWDNGGWMISIDGTCVHDGASGTDLNNGTFDTAKAAIHEWRVNHLKSMIE